MIPILCPIPELTGNYIFSFLFHIRTLILVIWSRYVQCSKQLIMLACCRPDLLAQPPGVTSIPSHSPGCIKHAPPLHEGSYNSQLFFFL